MKKFLLSVAMLSFAAAQADVALQTTFKEGDNKAVAETVVFSNSLTQAEYNLNTVVFKVVVTKMSKNEEGALQFSFDFIRVADGVETVVAQPEVTSFPTTLIIGDEFSSVTFVVSEVESEAQAVAEVSVVE